MALHTSSLQTAIYGQLSGDSALTALVTGVFDDVPENTNYPFVRIGEETILDNSTKDLQGQEITITIHAYSEYRGKREVKQILGAIYDALHDSDMIVSNANLINFRFEFSDIVTESDGITRHGVMRFRAVIYDQ